MRWSSRQFLIAKLFGILLLATGTCAAQTGVYLGASAGQSKFKDACDQIGQTAAAFGLVSNCDDTATAFKAYLGYRFMPYLAIEGGYTRVGDVESSIGTGRAEVDGFGIPVYAVGILPLLEDRLWLLAKAGAVYWDGELEVSGPGGRLSDSDSGASFAFGAGIQYNITPMFGVRAEYEVFHDVGDDNGVNGDIHMWSVGGVVRF